MAEKEEPETKSLGAKMCAPPSVRPLHHSTNLHAWLRPCLLTPRHGFCSHTGHGALSADFYIQPEERRLYYVSDGPIEYVDCSGGIYQSVATAIAVTYHKV